MISEHQNRSGGICLEKNLVSIVIPTFNCCRTLELCLNSIKNQTYKNIELIVVDNNSTDRTIQIAQEYGAKIFVANIGMAAARNLGIRNSAGEFLFSIDSDFELPRKLVEDCVAICENDRDSVIIHEICTGDTFWAKSRAFEVRTYWGDNSLEVPRFFRRTLYDGVGSYDETFTAGEDYDFRHKLLEHGSNIGTSRFIIKHHEPDSLRSIVFKKYRYGKSMKFYLARYGSRALGDFSFVRLSWVRNKKLLLKNPQYTCGMLVIKFLQYIVAFIGFIQSA